LEIKVQNIKPAVRKGRKSSVGDLNKPPKIRPIQAIITPVEIVIQKGPRDDLLYFCLISAFAKRKGSDSSFKDKKMSLQPVCSNNPIVPLE
jgi:hypothetical protein